MRKVTGTPKSDVDKRWFLATLATRQMSGRQLAQRLGVEPSAWSRVLSGQRRLSVDEVQKVARELQVPPETIVERLGVEVAHDTRGSLAVRYVVGEDGSVKGARGLGRIPMPPGAYPDAAAGRVERPGHWMDGAVVVWNPSGDVGAEVVGRLAIYKERNAGTGLGMKMGVLKAGVKGKFVDEAGIGLVIEWAARVIWVGLDV